MLRHEYRPRARRCRPRLHNHQAKENRRSQATVWCRPTVQLVGTAAALQHQSPNKFDTLGTLLDDVTSQWESLCSVIRKPADEVIGPQKNIRQPWLSEATYNIIQLKAAENVYRMTPRDADFKAHSRPEWKLIETTTSPVLQIKWKRTFSTTTWDQHFVPLRRLQERSNLNPSCPASSKWTAHHGAPMRRLCSAGQNILRLPLITFQQPPLHLLNLNPFLLFLTQTWGLRNLLSTKSSEPSKSWRMALPLVPTAFPRTAEMCCQSRLTLSIHPSLEIWHSPCWLARRHHNHSV